MAHLLTGVRDVWAFFTSDRGLAYLAIIIGVGGILRADWLFHKLYERGKDIRQAILNEAQTVLVSYAAFSRALQGVAINESDMTKDGAFALLASFRIQQLLFPDATVQQQSDARKGTREQVEKAAVEYAEMLVNAGLGKLKEGIEFNPKLRK